MPRFRTVASEVNTVRMLINATDIDKAEMITQIITEDRGGKKWHYLRHHLRDMNQADIQAFIDRNPYQYFAKKIAKELLPDEPPQRKDFTMQGMIDFDTPEANPYQPETDYAHTLTITMGKGKMLGEPLRDFIAASIGDMAIEKGQIFITITRTGVKINDLDEQMPFPRGVTAQGNGTGIVRAEALYRMLVRSVKKPSWITGYSAFQMKTPETLGDARTKIKINGKVEVKTGNFTATLATPDNPMPPSREYNQGKAHA